MEINGLFEKSNFIENLKNLIDEDAELISNLSNISRLIFESFDQTSWCGFYLVKGDFLYLGPYQGPIACTRIKFGHGVCGNAWKSATTQLVPNVHEYPGHIACSTKTNSEIVIPILKDNQVIGVIDLDSEQFDNFHEDDRLLLEIAASIISNIM